MSNPPIKKQVYHEFLPSIAKIYGINAAVIFQYISYREFNDSRRFVGVTIPDLMTLYPYMGRNQIWAALQALNRPTRKTSAILSRRGHGLSFEYSSCLDYDNGAPRHKFNVELATQVGVVPAIIYANVSHWIEYNWQDKTSAVVAALKLDDFKNYVELEAFAYAQTRPAAYHLKSVFDWTCQHRYIPLRTAERGFQTLVSAGLLEVVHRSNRLPAWHLPKQEMAKIALKYIRYNALELVTAKRNCLPPKGNDCRQNQTIAAKIKRKHVLTCETTDTSDAVNKLYSEASVTEAILRTFTSSQAESQLADARRDSEPENEVSTASPSLTLSPEMTLTERQKIMRRLDPETKQKVIQFGKGYTSEIEKRVYRDERGKVMQRPYKRTEKVIPDYVPGTDPGEHEFYSYPK